MLQVNNRNFGFLLQGGSQNYTLQIIYSWTRVLHSLVEFFCTVCPILAIVKSTNFLGFLHKGEQLFHLHLSTDLIHVVDRRILRMTYLNHFITIQDLKLFLIPCKCLLTIRTYHSALFDLSTITLKLCWELQSGWNEWNKTTCLSVIKYFELEEKCNIN
jgi:hypothetical protein